jgi:hypothetical protein
VAEFICPTPYGLPPEVALFGAEGFEAPELFALVDVDDPDIHFIIDSVRLMRAAGLDLTDPEIFHLAVEGGHRRAAYEVDESGLLVSREDWQAWRRSEERDVRLPGWKGARPRVYYARLGNRCKIGWSTNVRRRMISIQPEELLAIELGGPDVEAERHEQFAALRVVGEWFRYEGSLVDHVESLRGR